MSRCGPIHRHRRCSRRCRHIGFVFFLLYISSVDVGPEVHEVGDVEIVFIVLVLKIVVVIHNTISSDADEWIKCFWRSNGFSTKEVLVRGRRTEYASEHDVGSSEGIIEDLITDFAVRRVELREGCTRAVVGIACGAALRTVHRDPGYHRSARAIESKSLRRTVGDCDGLAIILVDKYSSGGRNGTARRPRRPLKSLRAIESGARGGRRLAKNRLLLQRSLRGRFRIRFVLISGITHVGYSGKLVYEAAHE